LQIWGSDVICGIVNMFSTFLFSYWKLLVCEGRFCKFYLNFSIIFDLDFMFFLASISFSAFFLIFMFDELFLFFYELFTFFFELFLFFKVSEFLYLDLEFNFFLISTGYPLYIILTHYEIEFFYFFFYFDLGID